MTCPIFRTGCHENGWHYISVAKSNRRMSIKGLREHISHGARIAGRRYRVIDIPKVPPDFAVDPDHAKTIFVRFE